jgi:hypothetical protein
MRLLWLGVLALVAVPTAVAVDLPPPPSTTLPLPTSTSLPLPTTSLPLPTSTSVPLPKTTVPSLPTSTSSPPATTTPSSSGGSTTQSSSSTASQPSSGSGGSGGSGGGSSGGGSAGGASAPGAGGATGNAAVGTIATQSGARSAGRARHGQRGPSSARFAKRATLRPVVRFRVNRTRMVTLRVVQLAPRCARVGSFRRKAHAGANAVRLPRRVKGRLLRPGTYRVTVRIGGRRFVRVVAVGRVPLENECAVAAALAAVGGDPLLAAAPARSGVEAAKRSQAQARSQLAAAGETAAPARGGVLGAAFTLPSSSDRALRVLFFVGAALAVLLFAVAALPRGAVPAGAAAALIVRRRRDFVIVGVLILAAVEIAFLVSRI